MQEIQQAQDSAAAATFASSRGKYASVTKQSKIGSYITKPASVSRTKKNNLMLMKMVVRDMQPFSIVEDRGFREYVAHLDPSCQLPSRRTLTRELLPRLYDDVKEDVQTVLSGVETVSLTTDSWTSRSTENYIAVTAHYITAEWEMGSYLLECFQYSERHTAENLRDELLRVIREWKLEGKVVGVCTDNAANITTAVKLAKLKHLPCFAHTLNLVVQKGVATLAAIQVKVKAIVAHFHRSTVAAEKLRSLQQQMQPDNFHLRLINDVVTRWNSTFEMFNRICQLREPLQAAIALLNNPVETLTDIEWTVLREVSRILKPFQVVTTEMSGDKYVTVSKVIMLAHGLSSACTKIKATITTQLANELVDTLLADLNARFGGSESNMVLAIATFLDPRFKKNAFQSANNYSRVKEVVTTEAAKLSDGRDRSITAAAATVAVADSFTAAVCPVVSVDSDVENLIWGDFDSRTVTVQAQTSPQTEAILQVRQYVEEPFIGRRENPLAWWFARVKVYPRLSKLALRNFCMVATSVPSERVFSKAGQLISDRRARLSPKNVQAVMFTNANMK